MKRITALTIALTIIATSAVAAAQSPVPEVGKAAEASETVAEVTKYDFEEDQIEGSFAKPLGTQISGEKARKLKRLKIVRTDFHDELVKSALGI